MQISLNNLIIFTRYPEPGTTKTRLIPVLGDLGAANLHKKLTEYTIAQVTELQKIVPVIVEVYFTGGTLPLMTDWLGTNLVYQSQGDGDLGARMMGCLRRDLSGKIEPTIIIGTDCPGINPSILATAFEQLGHFDLILGPAIDGGYYLIGLRQFIPELFWNIPWGSSQVFSKTREIAQQQGLSVFCLPPLADIDHPEDLSILSVFDIDTQIKS